MAGTVAVNRSIRLKERSPDTDVFANLIPAFVERSDETLGEGPFRMRTDSDGFIVTGNEKPKSDEPIAIIGGSFVESSFCPEELRFAAQAERLMPGYRVLNGGYSGSTTLQLFNVMVSKVFPVIGVGGKLVFFVGQSDADVIKRDGSYWTNEKLWSPVVPGFAAHPSIPNGAESVRKMVKIVIDTARTLEIDLILASSPYRDGDFNTDQVLRKIFRRNREVFDQRQAARESIRLATIEVGQLHGVDVIDFQGLTGGDPSWFYDDLHLNEHGQEQFSKVLVRELKARI